MAIMIPEEPDFEGGGSAAERTLWQALKKELSDDFYVLHNIPFLTKGAVAGESDFLVLHQKFGVLNIECKGKGVYRGPDGKWVRTNKFGKRTPLKKSPMEQAQEQINLIIDRLSQAATRVLGIYGGRFPLVYGWTLAFPFTRTQDLNLPLELQPEIVVGSQDFGNLEARVLEAYQFYHRRHHRGRKEISAKDLERLIGEGIVGTFEGGATIAGKLDHERQRFIKLSQGQSEVIRSLLRNRRLAVSGGAGTGKTILAMQGARLLARQGKRVLVTCFTSALAEYLRKVQETWEPFEGDGEVYINNFHAICVDAVGHENLNFPKPGASAEELHQFWAEEAPFGLLQMLSQGTYERGAWDAIIVDEAQDFYHEWWAILEEGLTEEGQLALFYDPGQTIFAHSSPLPLEGMTHYDLYINFRNTQSICDAVTRLSQVELVPHEGCPAGEVPRVYQQPGPAKTRRMVEDLVQELIEKEQCRYEEIAILTPRSPRNSTLGALEELGGQPVVSTATKWFAGQGVLHSSISAFKGMEADIVILVDIDPDDVRCAVEDRYVAASRAKLRLYVFEKDNWLQI